MPRYAPTITLDQLKSLCHQKLGIGTDDFDPYEFPAYIQKDLDKVQFDLENWCIGNADPSYTKYPSDHEGLAGYPCGYEVLSNDLPVLFVNAGGDWEFPVCFVLYWDGVKIRAYVPSNGNCWNKKEKCAYGSEDGHLGWDGDSDWEADEFQSDADLIRSDVMNRIQIK
jgi:hypothetical protein